MAARIFEMNFKLGAELAKTFGATMKGAQGALGDVSKELSKVAREAADIGGIRKQQEAVQKAAREHEVARKKLQELSVAYRAAEKPTAAMTRELSNAQKAVEKTSNQLSTQRSRLQSLTSAAGVAGVSMQELARRQKALEAQADRTRIAQQKLAGAISARDANAAKMGQARGRLMEAAAIGASLALPIKQSIAWEQSLAELNKVASLSPDKLKEISNAAQDMAVQTGVAREEIMGAYISAAQAGFVRDEWEDFAEVSAKMGVAFDITGDQAGEMLKAWRSGMALTMKDAELLAAAANHIANNMNATAADVGEVLQRQGATLAAAGIKGADAAALSAALLSGGASAEIAATASKNFAKALSLGDDTTGAKRKKLEDLGIDPERLAKDMQAAPREAIMGVLSTIRELDADKQLGAISRLFGDDSVGAIAPLVSNLENLKGAFELVGDSAQYASSLQDEFDAMGNTSQQNAKKFQEQMKVIATQVGDVLKPALTEALEAIMPILNSVSKWIEENPKLVKTVVLVAGAIGALTVGAIAGTYVFTALKGAFLAVRVAMLTMQTQALLMGGALAATPIGWLLAGLAAIVAIGYLVYKNWDKIKVIGLAAWEQLKGALEPFREMWDRLKESVGRVVDIFRATGEESEKTGVSLETLQRIGEVLGKILNGALTIAFIPLRLVGDIIIGVIDMFGNMAETVKRIISEDMNLFESGKAIINTLIDGVKSMVGNLVGTVKDAFGKVRDLLPFSDAKAGPFAELTASGAAIMQTLGEGIEKAGANPMISPFKKAAGALMDGHRNMAGTLRGAASNLLGAGGGGATINMHLTQNISVGGGADARQQARDGAKAGAGDILKALQDALKNGRRKGFD